MSFKSFLDQQLDALMEKYSPENQSFLKYMKAGNQFDPYDMWWELCHYVDDHGYLDEVNEALGTEYDSASELADQEDPDAFERFPEEIRSEIEREVPELRMRHDPAEAPTTMHATLEDEKPLNPNTWLIHFSNNARDIRWNGFKQGIWDMNKLGLTTYYSDAAKKKSGYNFAFLAGSREAYFAASKGRYGKHAVMFQGSGVHIYHYSDEENQIVFWGPDVDPKKCVLLLNEHGDWTIYSRLTDRKLFSGYFEEAEKWVMQNAFQYRRHLFG